MVSPPRFQVVPSGAVASRGSEAVELARNAGLDLSEEQQLVLHGGLGVRADKSWTALEVANVQPRQNGKSSTLQARIILALGDGEQVAYTCHRVELVAGGVPLARLARGGLPELAPLLKRVIYSNGKESWAKPAR